MYYVNNSVNEWSWIFKTWTIWNGTKMLIDVFKKKLCGEPFNRSKFNQSMTTEFSQPVYKMNNATS
jgi:hypothetical protein